MLNGAAVATAAVVEQQALFAHGRNARFSLCTGAGVEKTDGRREQLTVADLAGIAGGVDLLTHANAAEAFGTPVKVFKLGFHFYQALYDRPQLHA